MIDELHSYRGVFGSHLANVLRRLQRICRVSTARTRSSSAPRRPSPTRASWPSADRAAVRAGRRERRAARREIFRLLQPAGREPAARHPPLLSQRDAPRRAPSSCSGDLQTIVFANSRLATRSPVTYLKDDFDGRRRAPTRVRGYRGGYLPQRAARDRDAGCATASPRRGGDQRAGAGHRHRRARCRGAGRLSRHHRLHLAARRPRRTPRGRSAAVLVASARRSTSSSCAPRRTSSSVARARADQPGQPGNLVNHLKCAAFELPFARRRRSSAATTCRRSLQSSEEGWSTCTEADGKRRHWHWTNEPIPPTPSACARSPRQLRGRGHHRRAAGDRRNGFHQRAVHAAREGHLHRRGQQYQVERLDFDAARPTCGRSDCDYYTDAITLHAGHDLDVFALGRSSGQSEGGLRPTAGGAPRHGEVHVASHVVGFKKIKFYTQRKRRRGRARAARAGDAHHRRSG